MSDTIYVTQGDQMSAFNELQAERLAKKRKLEAQAKAADGDGIGGLEYERVQGILHSLVVNEPVESAALGDAQAWLESADRYHHALERETQRLRRQLESLVGESERILTIRDGLRSAVSQLHGYDVWAEDAPAKAEVEP